MYGASVVAEGIENVEQRDFLHANGCDFGQGHFFAKPMDAALLGTYALTHIVAEEPGAAPGRRTGS
jgi:EAL domain-containing protein (putative c-di-GMP-specific phosphodiesterase class I)